MHALGHLLSESLLVERLGWTLVHFLWQGALVALLLAVLLALMHRAVAGALYCFLRRIDDLCGRGGSHLSAFGATAAGESHLGTECRRFRDGPESITSNAPRSHRQRQIVPDIVFCTNPCDGCLKS